MLSMDRLNSLGSRSNPEIDVGGDNGWPFAPDRLDGFLLGFGEGHRTGAGVLQQRLNSKSDQRLVFYDQNMAHFISASLAEKFNASTPHSLLNDFAPVAAMSAVGRRLFTLSDQ